MKKEIINKCAELFDVHPRDLVSDARFGFLMPARFALYKALHLRGWAYARIGRWLGGRDHTTIIHGVNRATYMMERDPDYEQKVIQLATMSLLPPPLPDDLVDKYMAKPPEPEPELKHDLSDYI